MPKDNESKQEVNKDTEIYEDAVTSKRDTNFIKGTLNSATVKMLLALKKEF